MDEDITLAVSALSSLSTLPHALVNNSLLESGVPIVATTKKTKKDPKVYYIKKKDRVNLPQFPLKPPKSYLLMPNTDPRTLYPKRIVDYLNRGNWERYRVLMTNICSPDLLAVFHYDGIKNPYGPNYREIVGVQNVIDFYILVMQTAADYVLELQHETVRCTCDPETNESFISFKLLSSQTVTMLIKDIKSTNVNSNSSGNNNSNIIQNIINNSSGNSECNISGNNESTINSKSSGNNNSNSNGRDNQTPSLPLTHASTLDSNITSTCNENSSNALESDFESLISNFQSFSVEELQVPTEFTYHCGTYSLILNSEGKITHWCNFFKMLTHKPAFI